MLFFIFKTKKMLKNLIKFLALFCALTLCSEISKINSNNFCKLADQECTKRNAPNIFQCGPGVCARNETECQ